MNDIQTGRDRDEFRAELEAAAARTRPTESKRTSGAKSRATDETAMRERDDLDTWAPPSMLTLPHNDDYWVYRWVTEYVNGAYMAQRLSAAKRDGYEFVRIDELPEGFIVDEDMKGDGIARVGGLVMARMPRRKAQLRKAYYERKSAEMLNGANQLQGIAGKDSFEENRGTRSLDGRAAGEALRQMAQ